MRKLLTLVALVGLTVATITSPLVTDKISKSDVVVPRHHREKRGEGILSREDVTGRDELTGKSNFRIDVDEEEIEELIRDFKEFTNRYISRTEAERIALLKKLRLAYKHTAAKLLLNFGRTIPPLVSSWAHVMKGVQVNP